MRHLAPVCQQDLPLSDFSLTVIRTSCDKVLHRNCTILHLVVVFIEHLMIKMIGKVCDLAKGCASVYELLVNVLTFHS